MKRPERDAELVQIVDAELAEATHRSLRPDGSSWLACRPGCTPCCHGVFRISMLDAARLADGMEALRASKPEAAAQIEARASRLTLMLAPTFPGDPRTGLLDPEDERWESFSDLPEADAPCPVLDPGSGQCMLYSHRPLTCRVFGPPVRNEGGIGMCELCYVGAPEKAVFAGEMQLRHQELEEKLTAELPPAETLIAWAVRRLDLPNEEPVS